MSNLGKKMRKAFDIQKESFSAFSASLVAGDTAVFSAMGTQEGWLGQFSGLLRRGVAVRTPSQIALDAELCRNTATVEELTRLAAAIDRKAGFQGVVRSQKAQKLQNKEPKGVLESKVFRLIEEQGLGVVEACRKVRCRPSDYYIYRSKLKTKSYGR